MSKIYDYEEIKSWKDYGDGMILLTNRDDSSDRIIISESNFYDEFVVCEDCDGAFIISDMNHSSEVDDQGLGIFCDDCIGVSSGFFWCDYHNRYEDESERIYIEDRGENWCEEACNDHGTYCCWHCDRTFAYSDSGQYDDCDDWYCDHCIDCGYGEFGNGENKCVRCYHSTPYSEKCSFIDTDPRGKEVHIGFELEVHRDGYVSDDDTIYVYSEIGDITCMEEDGSIDPGFEIISRPGSIKYWESHFDRIGEVCKELVDRGYVSHNGGLCGFHNHIDRAYFGTSRKSQELAEAKFLYIFEKHWENLVKFSRRKNIYYCNKLNKASTETIKEIVKNEKQNRYKAIGHFTAVNIGNTNTIELRLWRGSLRYSTLLATLKFSARLAWLVKNKTVMQISKMSFEEILGDDPCILTYWDRINNRTTVDEN